MPNAMSVGASDPRRGLTFRISMPLESRVATSSRAGASTRPGAAVEPTLRIQLVPERVAQAGAGSGRGTRSGCVPRPIGRTSGPATQRGRSSAPAGSSASSGSSTSRRVRARAGPPARPAQRRGRGPGPLDGLPLGRSRSALRCRSSASLISYAVRSNCTPCGVRMAAKWKDQPHDGRADRGGPVEWGTPAGRAMVELLWDPPPPATRGPRQRLTVDGWSRRP